MEEMYVVSVTLCSSGTKLQQSCGSQVLKHDIFLLFKLAYHSLTICVLQSPAEVTH